MQNKQLAQLRREKILFTLGKMKCLSRSQLQIIFQLKSPRNTIRVLNDMSQYINAMRRQENVYYLNKKGCQYIGKEYETIKAHSVDHTVMCNDIYIYYQYPKDWKMECPADWKEEGKEYRLISDARFTYHDIVYFVEADNKQKMINNRKKLEMYASLFRIMRKQSSFASPLLIFYTASDLRKKKIIDWCRQLNVTAEVLTKADIY